MAFACLQSKTASLARLLVAAMSASDSHHWHVWLMVIAADIVYSQKYTVYDSWPKVVFSTLEHGW